MPSKTNKICRLSIICPAFNEEEVLPYFHEELSSVLDGLDDKFQVEVLYVDDGSRDHTLEVIKAIAREDRRVRYLSFSRNFGYQAALTAGLEHSRGDGVIMMDTDLQHPPALIPTLLEKWQEGHDLVLTIRAEDPHSSWFKRATSRWFYRIMNLVSDTTIPSSASDYRLLSRRAVDGLLDMGESHRFLRGMVDWLGFPTTHVCFKPPHRQAGRSKYTLARLINLALDAIMSFSKVPLRLSMFLGLLAILFSLGFFGWSVARTMLSSTEISLGWSALLSSIYLMGGCILSALGLLGEYVGRIFDQVKNRPLYLLKDSSREGQKPRTYGRERVARFHPISHSNIFKDVG